MQLRFHITKNSAFIFYQLTAKSAVACIFVKGIGHHTVAMAVRTASIKHSMEYDADDHGCRREPCPYGSSPYAPRNDGA